MERVSCCNQSIRESIGNQGVSRQALLICAKIVLNIALDIVLNSKTRAGMG